MDSAINIKLTLPPWAAMLLGVGILSFTSILVKLVSVDPSVIGLYRCLFGLSFLGAAQALGVGQRRALKQPMSQGAFAWAFLSGALFALDLSLWHRSIFLVGPGLATLINGMQVLVLSVLGVLVLGEVLRLRVILAVGTSFVGLALVVGTQLAAGGEEFSSGVLLAGLSAVAYAGAILVLKIAVKHTESGSDLLRLSVMTLSGTLFFSAESLLLGQDPALPSAHDFLMLLSYAFLAQFLAWLLISRSLEKVSAIKTGMILLLQPALTLLWDVLILGAVFSGLQLFGVLLLCAAIYFAKVE